MLKSSQKDFIKRHIGPSEADQQKMLNELGFENLDDLISKTVPEKILLKEDLGIIFSGTVFEIKSSKFQKLFLKKYYLRKT